MTLAFERIADFVERKQRYFRGEEGYKMGNGGMPDTQVMKRNVAYYGKYHITTVRNVKNFSGGNVEAVVNEPPNVYDHCDYHCLKPSCVRDYTALLPSKLTSSYRLNGNEVTMVVTQTEPGGNHMRYIISLNGKQKAVIKHEAKLSRFITRLLEEGK